MSLRKLDLKFGAAPKHLGPIADYAQILSAAELRRLTNQLALFHRKFPQVTLAVVIAESPAGSAMGEYVFWLANRMRFSAAEAIGAKNFDLLLVLGIGGTSGFSAGYGLENLVAEEDLARVLEAGQEDFAAERWAAGIAACVDCLIERLREVCRK